MIEVADIFSKYSEAYREKYKLSYHMLKVLSAIEFCRTSQLGGHVDECDECGHTRISYNSCRNRHCPKCQSIPKERWIDNRKRDLLPTQYFHVVFTLPKEVNPLTLRNKEGIYSILFKACSETLIELSQDKKYLGVKIGFISILHTWGQNLMDHPHIHCIVTGGGLSTNEKKWVSSKKDFFIRVKVLSKKFKGKFLHYLKQYYYSSKLKFPGDIQVLSRRSHFQRLLNEMYEKEWVVYCKTPFSSPKYVLEYLGRYTHKVAISNNRIVKLEDDMVSFKWRDYKDNNKSKLMTLNAIEFIRRFMLHVLPHRFVKIRHFEILSNRNRKNELKKCKELLGILQDELEDLSVTETWEEQMLRLTGIDFRICPCCDNGHMRYKRKLIAKCYSPPSMEFVA